MALASAEIEATASLRPELPGTVHLDFLGDAAAPRFAVIVSSASQSQTVTLTGSGVWRGLFTNTVWKIDGTTRVEVPPGFAEIFTIKTEV